jgi:flagellar biosynthesis/type III secretory pathway M-ring protein FliF/YscJ
VSKKHIWILLAVVFLILLGVVAGWAWTAGAAAAGAAAAAKVAAELAARQKAKATIVEAEEDVDDAIDEVAALSDTIDAGTVEIEKEISEMTPDEKIALAKELLLKADA